MILFDEANATDTTHGGGHIGVVMAGAGVKNKYQSSTPPTSTKAL